MNRCETGNVTRETALLGGGRGDRHPWSRAAVPPSNNGRLRQRGVPRLCRGALSLQKALQRVLAPVVTCIWAFSAAGEGLSC